MVSFAIVMSLASIAVNALVIWYVRRVERRQAEAQARLAAAYAMFQSARAERLWPPH